MRAGYLHRIGGLVAGALALVSLRPASAATFTVANRNDSGTGSLRQAILDANAAAGADTIQFASGTDGAITLTSGELGITDDLTMSGPGSARLTISGNSASRVFQIGSSATASIANVTITQGRAERGGGILNKGTLTLTSVVLSNNQAIGNAGSSFATLTGFAAGGGIFNDAGATLTVSGSRLTGNQATGASGGGMAHGGAIYNLTAMLTVTHSMLDRNVVHGGDGGTTSVANLLDLGATIGEGAGGGIYSTGPEFMLPPGILSVDNCTLDANQAIGGNGGSGGSPGLAAGAAIDNALGALLQISRSTFTRNVALGGNGGTGGSGFVVFSGSALGGGIFNAGTVAIGDSSLSQNQALGGNSNGGSAEILIGVGQGLGGALHNLGKIDVANTTLSANLAIGGNDNDSGSGPIAGGGLGEGGGLYNGGNATVDGLTVDQNRAVGGAANRGAGTDLANFGVGGGVGNTAGQLVVTNSRVLRNDAVGGGGLPGGAGGGGQGGGIYTNFGGGTTVSDTTLTDNRALGGAGGAGAGGVRGGGGNGEGGGLFNGVPSPAFGNPSVLALTRSVVTRNQAVGASGDRRPRLFPFRSGQGLGGGVFRIGPFTADAATSIAGNHASTGGNDVFP